jgi:hypothetical protein
MITATRNSFLRKPKFLGALCLVWVGFVLGVSFLATPVKFQAPHLVLPVALEVGKVTFQLFNKIELLLFISTVLLAVLSKAPWKSWFFGVFIGLILLSQTCWLLPALANRADIVMAGDLLPTSHIHSIYVALECLKLIFLLSWAKVTLMDAKIVSGRDPV